MRASDIATRYGGEEIAVLLPQTDSAGAWMAAERFRKAVEALAVSHAGNSAGHVTVSVGVAALVPSADPDAPALLVRSADRALYEAKAAGRNRVRQAEPVDGMPVAETPAVQ
jgi:diguanylate cyclase (GGDEF)-like protein